MTKSLSQRLEDLRSLLDRAGWDENKRGPGLSWNPRHGESLRMHENSAMIQARCGPIPTEKWNAWIDNFGSFNDDPEKAVAELEREVHERVRRFAAERVLEARKRLEAAEDVARRVYG